MNIHRIAMVTATVALGASPALALADHGNSANAPAGVSTTVTAPPTTTPPVNHGTAHKQSTPGPSASLPTRAHAYGRLCQGQSKTHVAGTPGTPFSKCVTDMAKLANGSTSNPRTACKDESKKHVAGTPGTPFSKCVSGAAKLLQAKAGS
jgi:hypothetical protein